MATRSKKWWIIHCGAGVVAAVLLAVSITQCSGKKSERHEKEKAQTEVAGAAEKLNKAAARIDSLLNVNRGLGQDNRAKADTIRMQRDSIATLNDSIVVLNDSLGVVNGQLTDCRNGQRKPTKPTKPTKPCKPCRPAKPTKPVVVKPDTLVVVVGPDSVARGGNVRVEMDNSRNNGNVVIAPTNVNQTEVVLRDGSVNNGNIVVGNNNNVVVNNIADTLRAYQSSCAKIKVTKRIVRVK
ncbi:MAG: hypothetical protein IJX89_03610 [Alphaproteobacteria bacterium]|nr:hypothetical protein [Alphaproteobacteria bacterium]